MRRALLAVLFASPLTLAGCDKLFPELTGSPADLGGSGGDGGDLPAGVLVGHVCTLSDLRTPTSCAALAPGRRVTIEENRAAADVAGDGTFMISLAGVKDTATIAVSDGPGTVGRSAPTISVMSGATLDKARTLGAALPSVPAAALSELELEMGVAPDTARGALVSWLFTHQGAQVAGAHAAPIKDATGPLYDGGGQLIAGVATGADGAIAFLRLPPGDADVAVTTEATATVAGDRFTIPIRAGAITAIALELPTR